MTRDSYRAHAQHEGPGVRLADRDDEKIGGGGDEVIRGIADDDDEFDDEDEDEDVDEEDEEEGAI
jgi:hypothetical protein